MNRWTCIFLCAALSASGKMVAQTCAVSGTVLDPSGAAIVGANVQLQAAPAEQTTTDQLGGFVLHCVRSNSYQLTVHAEGFAESKMSGKGPANLTVHLRIADVHTDIEVGENSGVSVDADHGAGTHADWPGPSRHGR